MWAEKDKQISDVLIKAGAPQKLLSEILEYSKKLNLSIKKLKKISRRNHCIYRFIQAYTDKHIYFYCNS